MINRLYKVIRNGSTLTLVIRTEETENSGFEGFWCYQFSLLDWVEYFTKKSKETQGAEKLIMHPLESVTQEKLDIWCDDPDTDTIGASWGDFDTVEQAIESI